MFGSFQKHIGVPRVGKKFSSTKRPNFKEITVANPETFVSSSTDWTIRFGAVRQTEIEKSFPENVRVLKIEAG